MATKIKFNFENNLFNPRPNEHVILYLHRHWFILFLAILQFVVLASLPIIIYFVVNYYFIFTISNNLMVLLTLGLSAYYLFIWLLLFNRLLDHLLDVWIVTNERVINIEQKNLFSRLVAEKPLDKMQDITVLVNGFFPTVLDYGDVLIQTAGSVERFIFKQVPKPKYVSNVIMDAVERYRIKHGLEK